MNHPSLKIPYLFSEPQLRSYMQSEVAAAAGVAAPVAIAEKAAAAANEYK